PTMYIPAISTLEPNSARGNVRCGSRISSLIAETSSRPVNANAICDQKFTVSQFHVGFIAAQVKCVTDPLRDQISPAITTSISSGAYVDTPPAFCSHLPMFNPMMFSATATINKANDTTNRNVRFCASSAPPD